MEPTHVLQIRDGEKVYRLKVVADRTIHGNTELFDTSDYAYALSEFHERILAGAEVEVLTIDGELIESGYELRCSRPENGGSLKTISITLVTGEGLYLIDDDVRRRQSAKVEVQRAIHRECANSSKLERAKRLGHALSAQEQAVLDNRQLLEKKLGSFFK